MSKRNWDVIRRQRSGSAIECEPVLPGSSSYIETTVEVVFLCEWSDGLVMGVVQLKDGHRIYARFDRTQMHWTGHIQPWQLRRIKGEWEKEAKEEAQE